MYFFREKERLKKEPVSLLSDYKEAYVIVSRSFILQINDPD